MVMLTYIQESKPGWTAINGVHVYDGYSGHGAGLNKHSMETARGVGPIPCGLWRIGHPYKHDHLGECVMNLTPIGHNAHGRSLFRIHGDNSLMNHTASDGCIILPKNVRLLIAKQVLLGLDELEVKP